MPAQSNGNLGVPLDLQWIDRVRIDHAGVETRCASLSGTSLPSQVDDLLRIVSCMDLTSLSDDDTPETIEALCNRAKAPVPHLAGEALRPGGVCVFDRFVLFAKANLNGTGIPVVAVTAGFPKPGLPLDQRVEQVGACVAAGAAEIDIVITRGHVLSGNWLELYEEVTALKRACGPARLKTILATGELETLNNVGRASLVCMMAGADFIKTSTGREAVNASYPSGLVMCDAIADFFRRTGHRVGFKPAGGIRTADQALGWLTLVRQGLGSDWVHPSLFRIGASSLIDDLQHRLAAMDRNG